MFTKISSVLLIISLLVFTSCKKQEPEKPFVFNGVSFLEMVTDAINGNQASKKILQGLYNFNSPLNSYNKILVDSILINNSSYYTLLLENQNPVNNLFAIVDKDLNVLIKDESLNGYLNLNFKKSGSKIFVVISEEFVSKESIQLKRISYYSLEQYASELAFRQFINFKNQDKEAEQIISVVSDTAIVTNIFYPLSKTGKTSKDVFNFNVGLQKYLSDKNLFDTLVHREIRAVKTFSNKNLIIDTTKNY